MKFQVVPAAFRQATMASPLPPAFFWRGLTTGGSTESVLPATHALPAESTATARATSIPEPPRYVEYINVPEGLSFVRKASCAPPWNVACGAAVVTGNCGDAVFPVT